MRKETSQWSKDVRKAAIDKDMSLKQLAESIGYSYAVVSSVINGRYSNASYKMIAEKINRELGTSGLPERVDKPSDEWCQEVKIELVKRNMSISQLAGKAGVSRDKLSMVINGRMMNEQIVEKVNSLLDISLSAVPACDS